jgi:hypothetical protein
VRLGVEGEPEAVPGLPHPARVVVREGPQPPRCVIQSCEMPPAPGTVFCAGHAAGAANGTAATPPIVEADNPALLAETARKAARQEEQEYAERRRVKTWKTLENGTRVPEEYWSDEELAAIERDVAMATRTAVYVEDPTKVAAKAFRRALKGRYGPAMQKMAEAFAETLEGRTDG